MYHNVRLPITIVDTNVNEYVSTFLNRLLHDILTYKYCQFQCIIKAQVIAREDTTVLLYKDIFDILLLYNKETYKYSQMITNLNGHAHVFIMVGFNVNVSKSIILIVLLEVRDIYKYFQ